MPIRHPNIRGAVHVTPGRSRLSFFWRLGCQHLTVVTGHTLLHVSHQMAGAFVVVRHAKPEARLDVRVDFLSHPQLLVSIESFAERMPAVRAGSSQTNSSNWPLTMLQYCDFIRHGKYISHSSSGQSLTYCSCNTCGTPHSNAPSTTAEGRLHHSLIGVSYVEAAVLP